MSSHLGGAKGLARGFSPRCRSVLEFGLRRIQKGCAIWWVYMGGASAKHDHILISRPLSSHMALMDDNYPAPG